MMDGLPALPGLCPVVILVVGTESGARFGLLDATTHLVIVLFYQCGNYLPNAVPLTHQLGWMWQVTENLRTYSQSLCLVLY
ncbi:hypothetical protein BC827DRAFT_1214323, partial [Russula dissimulans]